MFRRRVLPPLALGGILLLVAVLASCAEEEYPAWLWAEQHPAVEGGAAAAPAPVAQIVCRQAQAESLPARLEAMSASASSSSTILESDLFQSFLSVCGSCHGPAVDQGMGGFQITTAADFQTMMTAPILLHVTGSVCPTLPEPSSPTDPMPPCSSPNGGSYASRSDSDPVKQFAVLAGEWLQAGSPAEFTPTAATPSADAGAAASAFVMSPTAGNTMTNIGNCIPSSLAMVDEKVAALDAMFASSQALPGGTAVQAIGLPEHLGDTDLFTLDSATLAQYGVIAYAPGYPLWSDNAGKLRYVRVPHGTSIHFDKGSQHFEIPPNTRFYKTFMRQVVDTDGSYRYRKIETRLIVSRPDQNNPDGSAKAQTALFGTYQWNDDESDAVLVQTPLNDGLPFADTELLVYTDEPLAADLLHVQTSIPLDTFLVSNHAARHYAIPGSARCIECHMGSESQSFVLGFMPLQINRFATGTHGVIEATGLDELTQLQRLIAAGVVSGIDSPDDVLPLEQSQGSRTPRNDYELVAQGYVLGNCSHCHNPRGYPTVQNPVLSTVLDFLPGPDGGIFQFPLERYSPRIGRGLSGVTPIPYITPSLVDLPRLDPSSTMPAADIFVYGSGASGVDWAIYAPWRSIIYRNLESTFAYTDDLALYPHMPMNTPGYDPRGKQILSDWMVSIPAVRKHPEFNEYAYQSGSPGDPINAPTLSLAGSVQLPEGFPAEGGNYAPLVDWSPQPYTEVLPGDPQYAGAVAAAQQRLDVLHTGVNPAVPLSPSGVVYSRYADLLTTETNDILDPFVVADPLCVPIPAPNSPPSVSQPYPLPLYPQWVITDLTSPPGAWSPRQATWPNVLVEQQKIQPPGGGTCGQAPEAQESAYEDQVAAVGLLQDATLEQVSAYTTAAVPFGLWSDCGSPPPSSVRTVQSFQGAHAPHWMSVAPIPASDAPVYEETPGAAVFKMICINCHGPNADSNGRLAQNLATMTGGLARVADWHDGLFGPASSPGANIAAVFGAGALPAPDADAGFAGPSAAWLPPVTDDDRAARYMAWMGLGGTSVNIPVALLEIVAVTKVLGQNRVLSASSLSANMLSQAKSLCQSLIGPDDTGEEDYLMPNLGYLSSPVKLNTHLIRQNGDAELWLHLCAIANPPPIHVLQPTLVVPPTVVAGALNTEINASGALIAPSFYPPGTPIGNASGGVEKYMMQPCKADTDCPGVERCDTTTQTCVDEWPWCVDDTNAPAADGLPVCPRIPVDASHLSVTDESHLCQMTCTESPPACDPSCFEEDAANRWAVRGAINAGFSIFLYAQSIESSGPAPDYNQCNLMPSSNYPK